MNRFWTRRTFIKASLAAGLSLAAGRGRRRGPAARKLKVLILGGTSFLGPHTVQALLDRGHQVTLFNRGRTNPHLFPELEKLRGDRDPDLGEGLKSLEGRSFDVVLDHCGYAPRHVEASTRLLEDHVSHYLFVSTTAVYKDYKVEEIDESYPLASLDSPSTEAINATTYGPFKVQCEQAVTRQFENRATIVRPCLIVGPRDPTDRFTYWPWRVRKGGEVLAPGSPADPLQYTDVRDIADFNVSMVEDSVCGVFNLCGPETPSTMAELLHGCKAVVGGDASFEWVDAEFLEKEELGGCTDIPVWVAPKGDFLGFHRISNVKALEAGMVFRPLAETVEETLRWFDSQNHDRKCHLRAGLPLREEKRLLAAFRSRRK